MNVQTGVTLPAQVDPTADGVTNRVLLAFPSLDFKMDCMCVKGMLEVLSVAGGQVRPFWNMGDSNIRHCRNAIAHYFKTKALDCNRIVWVDSDIDFALQDFTFLMEGDEDLVVAPYARKAIGMPPVDFGMGFVRMSRRVFAKLDAWLTEDGSEALHRYYLNGEIAVDYFFDGATPDMRWMGEDTGFFHWCALLDMSIRQEKRCRLGHWGRFRYGYPDQTPGLIALESGAQ